MKQTLNIEINDEAFSVLAKAAHEQNVALNDYCSRLVTLAIATGLDQQNVSENPEQMVMNLKTEHKDFTKPPFSLPKEEPAVKVEPEPIGVPLEAKKSPVGRWVDPAKAKTTNSWLF